MLLLRIRTELKQTLMSYQELFEKSIVWGRQKMVEAEMGWERLVARREELEHVALAMGRVDKSVRDMKLSEERQGVKLEEVTFDLNHLKPEKQMVRCR